MKQQTPTSLSIQGTITNRAFSSLKEKRALTFLPVGERFNLKNYPCYEDVSRKKY